MERPRFDTHRYEELHTFHEPHILDEAQARINQRLQNYLTSNTEEMVTFYNKTPFLKELHPINGYPSSYIATRLSRVSPLPKPPKGGHKVQERIRVIMRDISDPTAKFWKRAVAVENLRRAFATDGFKVSLTGLIRKKELRMILVEAVQNQASRPLLEETCLTLMYIFYSIGTACSRKTSSTLAKAIINELSYHLTDISTYCDNLKAAKINFLDKKLILGDKAKDLRFWFPNFSVKRGSSSVHHASVSLLFYALAFLLFHTRHMAAAFEIALSVSLALKPLRFYLLNILDTSLGHFHYADLVNDPKLPRLTYNILSDLSQREESSKDQVTKKMAVSCCRKLYILCQNTPLHIRNRQISGGVCLMSVTVNKRPEDSQTSSDRTITKSTVLDTGT